jgi:hypothetical protein
MSTEKQDKFIREAADELNQLPEGFAFNANKTWKQLEQQLQPRKKNKAVWYYAAAAIILLMVTGAVFFMNHSANKINNQTFIVAESKNANADKKETVIKAKKNQPIVLIKTNNNKAEKLSNTVVAKASADSTDYISSQEENKNIIVEAFIAPQQQTIDSIKTISVAVQSKKQIAKTSIKKYKVVHINELDETVKPQPVALTKTETKKIYQEQIAEEKETQMPVEAQPSKQILFFKVKPATTTTTSFNTNP